MTKALARVKQYSFSVQWFGILHTYTSRSFFIRIMFTNWLCFQWNCTPEDPPRYFSRFITSMIYSTLETVHCTAITNFSRRTIDSTFEQLCNYFDFSIREKVLVQLIFEDFFAIGESFFVSFSVWSWFVGFDTFSVLQKHFGIKNKNFENMKILRSCCSVLLHNWVLYEVQM